MSCLIPHFLFPLINKLRRALFIKNHDVLVNDMGYSNKTIRILRKLLLVVTGIGFLLVAIMTVTIDFAAKDLVTIYPTKNDVATKDVFSCKKYLSSEIPDTLFNRTSSKRIKVRDLYMYHYSMTDYFKEYTNFICTSMFDLNIKMPCHCVVLLKNGTLLSYSSLKIITESKRFVKYKYTLPLFTGNNLILSEPIPEWSIFEITSIYNDRKDNWTQLRLSNSDVNTLYQSYKYFSPSSSSEK